MVLPPPGAGGDGFLQFPPALSENGGRQNILPPRVTQTGGDGGELLFPPAQISESPPVSPGGDYPIPPRSGGGLAQKRG